MILLFLIILKLFKVSLKIEFIFEFKIKFNIEFELVKLLELKLIIEGFLIEFFKEEE